MISLDFELYWGPRSLYGIDECRNSLLGCREAINKILNIFSSYDIHATWATVGFLFFNNLEHLKKNFPERLPKYLSSEFSPYEYIEKSQRLENLFHFAPDVIDLIQCSGGQEIGTHTFSHYYCIENGQFLEEFRDDICAAIKIAKQKGFLLSSLVFPRNQVNGKYLSALSRLGIMCYRGNQSGWMYEEGYNHENKIKRILRLLDAYVHISGIGTYELTDCIKSHPFNFPASHFLRSYSKKLAVFDRIRFNRIARSMEHAAVNNRLFHLWWHPENFGVHTAQNIEFLRKILNHFKELQKKHGMKSMNMRELSSFLS